MPAKKYSRWSYSRDPKNVVKSILDHWRPKGPRGGTSGPTSHDGWRDSLMILLQLTITDVEVSPETGVEHSRGDIALMWDSWASKGRHYFEIKTKLASSLDYDRVVGQVERYKAVGGDQVFVVLCGEDEIKPNWVEKLKSKFYRTPGVHVFWKRGPSRGVDHLTW
jgi:hypothetical protein